MVVVVVDGPIQNNNKKSTSRSNARRSHCHGQGGGKTPACHGSPRAAHWLFLCTLQNVRSTCLFETLRTGGRRLIEIGGIRMGCKEVRPTMSGTGAQKRRRDVTAATRAEHSNLGTQEYETRRRVWLRESSPRLRSETKERDRQSGTCWIKHSRKFQQKQPEFSENSIFTPQYVVQIRKHLNQDKLNLLLL